MNFDHFREIIEKKITSLEAQSVQGEQARAVVALDQQSVGRLSRQDALQQQAMAKAQEQMRQRELSQLKQALERLDDGSFGLCKECEEEIVEKRLEINPATQICVQCCH